MPDNDLRGPPEKVHGALLGGRMALLLALRRSLKNPCAVLENREGEFAQCYLEKKRRHVRAFTSMGIPPVCKQIVN